MTLSIAMLTRTAVLHLVRRLPRCKYVPVAVPGTRIGTKNPENGALLQQIGFDLSFPACELDEELSTFTSRYLERVLDAFAKAVKVKGIGYTHDLVLPSHVFGLLGAAREMCAGVCLRGLLLAYCDESDVPMYGDQRMLRLDLLYSVKVA